MTRVLSRQEDISVYTLRGGTGPDPLSESHRSVSVRAELGSTCLSVRTQAHLSHTHQHTQP